MSRHAGALGAARRRLAPVGLRLLALLLIVAGLGVPVRGEQSVTLAWDPNPETDIGGYIVYYGSASRNYTNAINVGNVTTNTVRGLVDGATYFFAVTAYNTNGLESDFSDEVSYSSAGGNLPPLVNAGPDRSITLPATASLRGTATDDGNPNPSATIATTWSKASGPGTVAFANAAKTNTSASFSAAGTYVLRLTASDGALSANDTVTIVVTSTNAPPTPNTPPLVNAGPNQTITLPARATLRGTAADDGRPNPPGVLVTTWWMVSGPGTVAFTNAAAINTTAAFSTAGTYVLRLTANDGALSVSDDLTVVVNPANTPPYFSGLPLRVPGESPPVVIPFVIGDMETAASALRLQGFSDHPAWLADSDLIFGGSGSSRTLRLNPRSGQPGEATVYLLVTDPQGASAVASFVFGSGTRPPPATFVHYPFEETAGADVFDRSGSGQHGLLIGEGFRTNGVVGQALRLDASNNRVRCTNDAALNVPGAFTLACWVRPESLGGSRYLLIKGDSSDLNYAYALRASEAKLQYRWVSPSGRESKVTTAKSVLTVGRWTHVAVAHAPGSLPTLFLNAVPVPASLSSGSATDAVGTSPYPFTVGASSDGGERFHGLMDEVFVCPGALVEAQIRLLTNGLPPGPPPDFRITTADPLPSGFVGTPYAQTLDTMEGTPPIAWTTVGGSLPGGLTLVSLTGVLQGTPTSGGTRSFRVRATDSAGWTTEKEYNLLIRDLPPVITFCAPTITLVAGDLCRATMPDVTRSEYFRATDDASGLRYSQSISRSTTLPLGNYTNVVCVTDAANNTVCATNQVTVVDATPPVIQTPGDLTAIQTNAAGNTVEYIASAYDACDAAPLLSLIPPSGSRFPPGTHLVMAVAQDAAGNQSAGSFQVLVRPPGPPPGAVCLWAFDELGGSDVLDSVGLNHGRLVNGTTRAAGLFGGAVCFNGIADQVLVSSSSALDLGPAFSLSLWLRPGITINSNSSRMTLLKKTGAYWLAFNYPNNDGKLVFSLNTDTPRIKAAFTTVWESDRWYHVACTYDGAAMRIYINGILEGTKTTTTAVKISPNPLQLGGDVDGLGGFDGCLDDVRIYRSVLTESEIAATFSAVLLLPGGALSDAALVAPASQPSGGSPP